MVCNKCMTVVVAAVFLSGCSMFKVRVSDVDIEKPEHLRSTYDYSDMRKLTEQMAGRIISSKFLVDKKTSPVMMVTDVQNRTERYVDTKSLTDRLRTLLHESGKVQFVNETRRQDMMKEKAYQAANATPETQTAIGKELGAKYMISGSFVEMQNSSQREVSLSKKEINYYKLTIEITNLETGILEYTAEEEFARKASLPLIGW